ncbi:MAG: 1-acyl-sn-glycerol-3-phosphate acyltransferase, partial [Okeania sp. SIO1H6]|nr:1-acyl-sn-glycerol-3-phosphate acyltransferase [Okeania sp. SIO1H6]
MINLDFIQASLRKLHSPVNSKPSSISPWLASLSYFLGHHIVMPLYFRKINIIGKENIPKDGPVILAPTHRSRWDGLIIPYTTGRLVTGRDLRFMVSMDEMKCLQGWLIR